MTDTRNLLNDLILEGEKHQAFRVSLACDDFPAIITDTGLLQSKVINSRVSDAMFREMLGAVFAHSSDFSDYQRQRRTLSISDVGSVEIFGLADLRCINVYYERGKSLFEIDLGLYFPGQVKKTAATETKTDENPDDEQLSISFSDVFGSGNTKADTKLPSANESDNFSGGEKTKHTEEAPASENLSINADEALNLSFANESGEKSKIASDAPNLPPPPPRPAINKKAAEQDNSVITNLAEVRSKQSSPFKAPLEAVSDNDDNTDDDINFQADSPATVEPSVVNDKGVNNNEEKGDPSGLDNLLQEMLRLKASDLHIVLDKSQAFRINGRLKKADSIVSGEQVKGWLKSVAPKKGGKNKFLVHGLIPAQVFMHDLNSGERFRVNVFKDVNGINVAVRSVMNRDCDKLNIPAVVRKFCGLSRGLVLVTGYSSSGISSTLTALIDLVNNVNSCNLLKVGNPVSEFKHATKEAIVRQIEVGAHVDSMDMALELSMRGDFDALFIDDLEVASLPRLLDCVNSGHLAFATLHAKAGASVLGYLAASLKQSYESNFYTSIRALVSQVLVPSVNGSLIAAFEVLVVDAAVTKLLMEHKLQMLPAYMEANANKGNITLNSSLVRMVIEGRVTYRSAMAAATDKREFYRTAIKHGIKAAA